MNIVEFRRLKPYWLKIEKSQEIHLTLKGDLPQTNNEE